MSARKSAKPRKVSRPTTEQADIAALRFEALPVDLSHFSAEWDLARGKIARMGAAFARMDDKAMEAKATASAAAAHAFMDLHDMFREEIAYLKTHTKMLDTISTRMLVVAHRIDPNLRRPQRPHLVVDNIGVRS